MIDSVSAATNASNAELAAQVIALATQAGVHIGVAESLTGGLVASTLVSVPGASKVFLGGVVAYATSAKAGLLGVPSEVLDTLGAVSAETAEAMAQGMRNGLSIDGYAASTSLVTVSTTGVAGPDTQDGQPVGTVFVGLATSTGVTAKETHFSGDRQSIRIQATRFALSIVRDEMQRHLGLNTV